MGREREKHIYYRETDREYYSSYFRMQFSLVLPWRYDEVMGMFLRSAESEGTEIGLRNRRDVERLIYFVVNVVINRLSAWELYLDNT